MSRYVDMKIEKELKEMKEGNSTAKAPNDGPTVNGDGKTDDDSDSLPSCIGECLDYSI